MARPVLTKGACRISCAAWAAALALAGGDEAVLLEILALFLDDCPAQLDAMPAAAARRDWHALAPIAHGLKGALQAIGARDAARLAEAVESLRRTAVAIAAGDERLQLRRRGPREIADLARAFDDMVRKVTAGRGAAQARAEEARRLAEDNGGAREGAGAGRRVRDPERQPGEPRPGGEHLRRRPPPGGLEQPVQGAAAVPQRAHVAGRPSSTVEIVDLRNTLLIRGAEAVAVDFYALVARNDLTQNVLIEPGGTIYVPSSLAREVHVLGEVEVPRRGRAPHQLPECPRRTSRAGAAR